MNAFDLTGKKILVTGASSGLGRQCAITASQYGATLVITGRNQERLLETFGQLSGEGHRWLLADLTSETELSQLVDLLEPVNGVVYSVGISDLSPARFIAASDISRTFDVSFKASVLLTSNLLKRKKLVSNSCSLVFISTISTRYPFVGGAMYISAKAALEAYARVLALEMASKGIRSNSICPAFVKTPMLDSTAENYSREAVKKIEERQPLGLGEPEDVANAVVFFLSDASRWITATNLILGGG